jgi:hypothetical protein
LAAACRKPPPPSRVERIDAALAAGGRFLAARQGEDGAIRSGSYPFFRDGYSLTPLALAAMFGVAGEPAVDAAYPRGVDFLTSILDDQGKLREDLQAPRYPLYSLAIGTLVLNVAKNERHAATRAALLAALRERQLSEDNGWSEADPSYGGWSYFDGVPTRTTPDDQERAANLSATLFAVGALALAGVPPDDPALLRARRFVERCQNADHDGGFFFAPAIPDGNKAGPRADGQGFRSYGSMTADGVRALLRLGLPPEHPRVAAARRWLVTHFDPTRNPGDFVPVNEVRRASSYYYWAWSAAHALRDLGVTEPRWAERLADALLERQRPDGSWANGATEMREDEPVVATSFAMAALAVCRIALTGAYRSHARQP